MQGPGDRRMAPAEREHPETGQGGTWNPILAGADASRPARRIGAEDRLGKKNAAWFNPGGAEDRQLNFKLARLSRVCGGLRSAFHQMCGPTTRWFD